MTAASSFLDIYNMSITLSPRDYNNMDNTPGHEFVYRLVSKQQYDHAMKYIMTLQAIVSVGGILGNVLCLCTFARMGLKDCVTITFFNLAISDLSFLVLYNVQIGIQVVHVLSSNTNYFISSFGMSFFHIYNLLARAFNAFARASIFFMSFLAIQRSLCVLRPLYFKGMFTRGRTFVIVSVIWVTILLFHVAQTSFLRIDRTWSTSTNSTVLSISPRGQDISVLMESMFDSVIVIGCHIIVLGCLVIMRITLMKSVRFRQMSQKGDFKLNLDKDVAEESEATTKGSLAGSKERQAIMQVVILSAFMIMAFGLNIIYMIVFSVNSTLKRPEYFFLSKICLECNTVFGLSNASVNFLVYFRYNTRFKEIFKSIFEVKSI